MATDFARTTRALDADGSGAGAWALPVGAALLLLWLAWFLLAQVGLYQVSRAARVEVLTASRQIANEQAGRLTAAWLQAGRRVRAGELLATLDDRRQSWALAAAEARLAGLERRVAALAARQRDLAAALAGRTRAAQAATAAAGARTMGAEATARFSRDLAERQRQDSADGGLAPVEAARAAAQARSADAAREALAQQQRQAGADAGTIAAEAHAALAAVTADLAEARSQLAAARLLVAQCRHDLRARQLRAPVDGVIGAVATVRLGAMLAAGTALATIVPADRLHIVARFDAAQGLGRLDAGQTARLRLDGFAWSQYGDVAARVEQVAAEPDAAGIRVELALLGRARPGLPLRHGMTGRVEVLTERVSPAVMLLRSLGQWAA